MATAIAVAALGLTAFSSYQQSKTQAQIIKNNASNQAAVADFNATATKNIGEFNAQQAEADALVFDEASEDSIARGVEAASDVRKQVKRSNARGRAAQGSSGLQVDTGTNLDLVVQNTAFGEMNAETIINNAEREAYGFRKQAASLRDDASGFRYTSGIQSQNIRLGSQVNTSNAIYTAGATRFGGK